MPDDPPAATVRPLNAAVAHIVLTGDMTQTRSQSSRAHRALGGFRGQATVRSWLYRIVTNLPDKLKEPLVLREFEGMSYQAIADVLDLPINTVRTRILRARRSLQDRMEAWR